MANYVTTAPQTKGLMTSGEHLRSRLVAAANAAKNVAAAKADLAEAAAKAAGIDPDVAAANVETAKTMLAEAEATLALCWAVVTCTDRLTAAEKDVAAINAAIKAEEETAQQYRAKCELADLSRRAAEATAPKAPPTRPFVRPATKAKSVTTGTVTDIQGWTISRGLTVKIVSTHMGRMGDVNVAIEAGKLFKVTAAGTNKVGPWVSLVPINGNGKTLVTGQTAKLLIQVG